MRSLSGHAAQYKTKTDRGYTFYLPQADSPGAQTEGCSVGARKGVWPLAASGACLSPLDLRASMGEGHVKK